MSLQRSRRAAVLALLFGSLAVHEAASAASLGGPLALADEGIFFVGARPKLSNFPGASPAGPVPPGTVMVDQMYVHYRIPVGAGKTPIVLVHGGGLTGASYETTPDGREGWATYFARKGFPVYVVDTPGRGRAGFDSTPVNRAKKEGDVTALPPNVLMVTGELAWPLFRFGPSFGTPYADTQYPVQAMAAFGAQVVPFGETFYEGSTMQTVPRALAELLDRIGPSVVVVHSLAGPFADALVELRPKLVRAVVNVEGAQNIVPSDKQVAAYSGVPVLELFGDHLDAPVFTAAPRVQARQAVVDRINRQSGGTAALKKLPDAGIKGNSHMMMQDKNNLQVADFILDWLQSTVK